MRPSETLNRLGIPAPFLELFLVEGGVLLRGLTPDIPREIQVVVRMKKPHLEFLLGQFFSSSFSLQSPELFDYFRQIALDDFKVHALSFRGHGVSNDRR